MSKIIFEIEKESWWALVNKSMLKLFITSLKVDLAFIILALLIQNTQLLITFIVLLIPLAFLILIRLPAFKNYIYRIEVNENIVIVHYYKFGNAKSFESEIGNFKINYYRHPQYMQVFIFEQKKPYKLCLKQYCFGYWQDPRKIEIFKPYASSIKYYIMNNPLDKLPESYS